MSVAGLVKLQAHDGLSELATTLTRLDTARSRSLDAARKVINENPNCSGCLVCDIAREIIKQLDWGAKS